MAQPRRDDYVQAAGADVRPVPARAPVGGLIPALTADTEDHDSIRFGADHRGDRFQASRSNVRQLLGDADTEFGNEAGRLVFSCLTRSVFAR